MEKPWRRSFALFLSLIMVIGMLPLPVFAADAENETAADPQTENQSVVEEVSSETASTESTEECEHGYEVVVTPAACTEAGYSTYTCTLCGDTYTGDAVDALGHSYEAVTMAPTCTEAGYTTYTCALCEDTYTADAVDALGHSYEAAVTAPSCTEAGYTTYTCGCGDTYTADEVPATGHTSGEDGKCTTCGELLVSVKSVAPVANAPVAQIGQTTYTSLSTAVNNASKGATITLLADTTVSVDIFIRKNLNIDLAGHTVTLPGFFILDGTVTISNGTLIGTSTERSTVQTWTFWGIGNPAVILNDVDIYSTRHGVRVEGGSVTINGGVIRAASSGSNTSYAVNIGGDYASSATINGGTFIGPTGTANGGGAALLVYSNGKVSINDGDFSGGKASTLEISGNGVTIHGGTFDKNPSSYVADGYVVEQDENGRYTVQEERPVIYVAQIGETKYETLAAAAEAAVEGDTITLLMDAALTEELDVTGKTVDLNGFALNGTIFGNLKVNGGSYVTSEGINMAAGEGDYRFLTNDAIFDFEADGDITLESGSVTLGKSWQTQPGQTVTVAQGAKLAVPKEKNLQIGGSVIVEGDLLLGGTVELMNGDATLQVSMGNLNVGTNIADSKVTFENGVYKVAKREYVAQVGDAKFESLQEAVDAAEAGQQVQLIADVTVQESVNLAAEDEIVLDLNGHTLQTDAAVNDTTSVHVIGNLGKLTVQDSVGTGAIIANDCATAEDGTKTKNGFAISSTGGSTLVIDGAKIVGTNWGYALYVVDAGTNVTIHEGSVVEGRGTLYLDSGAIGNVNGGTFTMTVATANNQDNVVYVGGASQLTITGGSFSTGDIAGPQRIAIAALGSSKVAVNGGTFYGLTGDIQSKDSASVTVTDGTFTGTRLDERTADSIALTGGTYSYDPAEWVAKGYVAIDNTDGTWTVSEKPVAKIGETVYASLAAAIEAAVNNDTITLLENIDLSEAELQLLDNSYDTYFLVEGKTVTIDLNGKTISGAYTGTNTMLVGVFSTDKGGRLTLTGKGTVDVTATNRVYALIANYNPGCTITIENGTYKLDKASDSLVFAGSDADKDITVKGGTFTLGNVGTGENGKPWIFNVVGSGDHHVYITGGTFNADVNHQHWSNEAVVAETCYMEDNGNGTWTVKDGAAAYVHTGMLTGPYYAPKNVGYASFNEALAAAVENNDSSITVLDTVLLEKEGTLDLKGTTVKAAKTVVNAPVFRVLANVTVTNGTVDGTTGVNSYAFIVGNSETAGTLTIADGEYIGVTSAISVTNGTANISGGTFKTGHDGEGTDYGAHYLLNCMDDAYKAGTAKYNVTGGTFHGFDPQNNAAEGAGTNFVAEGYRSAVKTEGVYEVVELFDLYGANMDLGNALDMNFYVLKTNITDAGSYAVITKEYANGEPVTITVPASEWKQQGNALWKFTFANIAAKEMADKIIITIYDSTGEQISIVREDGVRAYCMRMLNKSTDPIDNALYVDMLNYGAAAQVEFSYNTNDLANNQLTEEQKAYATTLDVLEDNSSFDKAYYYGANMDLESRIKFNMYFLRSKVTSDMTATITYQDHNGKNMSITVPGSEFIVQSKDL